MNGDFDKWMKSVDRAVETIAGLSVHDLADCCFRDWFEGGYTPGQAAREALANEGFEG